MRYPIDQIGMVEVHQRLVKFLRKQGFSFPRQSIFIVVVESRQGNVLAREHSQQLSQSTVKSPVCISGLHVNLAFIILLRQELLLLDILLPDVPS